VVAEGSGGKQAKQVKEANNYKLPVIK